MHARTKRTVEELARSHRRNNEFRMEQMKQNVLLGRTTPLLDFTNMLRELGGDYKILRCDEDSDKRKKHTGGRREMGALFNSRLVIDSAQR